MADVVSQTDRSRGARRLSQSVGQQRRGLWLGPIPSQAALAELPALSPAAVLWERGLFSALNTQGLELDVVSHRPEPLWPRGRLLPGNRAAPPDVSFPTHVVGHTNVPGLRTASLSAAYAREALALASNRLHAFVATFNPLPWHVATANELVRRTGTPWISFLLDDVLHDPALERYARVTREAAGHVILSAAAVDRIGQLLPAAPVLHLDGAVEQWLGDEEAPSRVPHKHVIYSGAHTEEAGMSLLVAAIPHVSADVTFTITGDRGSHAGLNALKARDPRVQTVGWVSPEVLHQISLTADAFVNPRPPAHGLSLASFPSKLMTYLKYGRPVASTWTPGLAREYEELLVVADGDTPQSLAASMDRAVAMDADHREALRGRIKAFLVPGHLWQTQACRFADFLEGCVVAGQQAA
jgi:hypothetical protein